MTSLCLHCSWCAKRIWILAPGNEIIARRCPPGLLVKIRQAFPLESRAWKRWIRGASERWRAWNLLEFPAWRNASDVKQRLRCKYESGAQKVAVKSMYILLSISIQGLVSETLLLTNVVQRWSCIRLGGACISRFATSDYLAASLDVRRVIGLSGPSGMGTFPYDPVWISCAPQRKKWCLSQRP